MIGSVTKTMVENILETTIGDTFFYQLLNVAKEIIEGERDPEGGWEYLIKLNESLSTSSSDTYTTAKSLAGITDFAMVSSLYVGSDTIPYREVPFKHRERFKNQSRMFYIDYASGNLYIMGGTSGTIHMWYRSISTDITSTGSWVFPARFHPLLAFYTAGYHQGGVDWDSIAARMSPENKLMAQNLRNAMVAWDSRLKAAQTGFSTPNSSDDILVGDHPDRLDTNM